MAVKKIGTLNKHENPATNENEFDIENYMNVNWDKIKEVVDNNADELTTTQGKVTTLETDNTTNKQDISDIKTEQESQNDLLQRTQNALINITTEKSSNINVKDSSDLNAKVDVYGISEQETRSGKNKFDIEKLTGANITDKDSKTGAFKMSNCWGIIVMDNDSLQEILKPNTQYKCIADVTLLSKPNDLNASNSSQILSLYNNQDVVVVNMLFTSNKQEKDNWEVNTKKHLSTTFTTPADLTGFSMLGYNYRTERATNEGSFKFENIMILEATEDDESFEQYGASPSPEYPSKIGNVTGNIDITVCNKNLAKIVDSIAKSYITMNGDGTFTINGTLQNNEAFRYIMNQPFKKGKYRLSLGIDYNNFNNSYHNIASNNGSEVIKFFNYNDTNFEIQEDCAITASIVLIAGTYNNLVVKPMIERTDSEISSDFVKHKEQLITFPLAQGQKLADGDYLARDGIHHVKKQKEFDGTEAFQTQAQPLDNIFYTAILINDMKQLLRDNLLSSHFKGVLSPSNNVGISGSYLNYLYFGIDVETIGALPTQTEAEKKELFKTWLAQQKTAGTPIIVEYELAEEEIEPYTPEQQEAYNKLQNVLSYYNVTNVFTDKAQLVFKYIADTKTYVDNETNSIKEQLNTINELLSTTATSATLLENLQSDLESEVT